MREEDEEYFEEDTEPEKCLIKGIVLSPFVAIVSVILTVIGLITTVLATLFAFFISLFRLSFDFRLAGKYTLSVTDKCATVFVAAICGMWYGAFHKNE